MLDGAERGLAFMVAGTAFDGQRALADLGQHRFDVEDVDDVGFETEAIETGLRHQDRIEFREAREPRDDVAPQARKTKIGTERGQLDAPSDGPRGHVGTGSEVGQPDADQHIARIRSFGHGRDHKTRRRDRR
ncbi:unannotated protein [freshwater metagenome]|uniref:Unannotated protein n=1 Tax=freshwater metagenome TaxID=449393 RepID=A0A6J7IFW4_9ZZZZ